MNARRPSGGSVTFAGSRIVSVSGTLNFKPDGSARTPASSLSMGRPFAAVSGVMLMVVVVLTAPGGSARR